MGDLLRTRHHADLVNGSDLGAQAPVDAQDLAVDYRRQDEEVKDVAAGLPHRRVAVLLLAFLVEAVYLRDLPGLVVASHQDNSIGVSTQESVAAVVEVFQVRGVVLLGLEAHEERKSLQAKVSSVDKVAQEDEAGVGALGGGHDG